MEGLELACFQIISKAGSAKSTCYQALKSAREGEFEKSLLELEQARSLFLEAHIVHRDLIQLEASGSSLNVSLLLVHAEDQLMAAESARDLIEEMIHMYKLIKI